MIIHYRETADSGKDVREFLESFSSHSLWLWSPSPSKNAWLTQQITQWYQRARVSSTNCARAIAIVGSPGGPAVLYAMPVGPSRPIFFPSPKINVAVD